MDKSAEDATQRRASGRFKAEHVVCYFNECFVLKEQNITLSKWSDLSTII